ncbi:MAG: hypothetical protein ACRD2C_10215 [Acidimicrobiales bacterium]
MGTVNDPDDVTVYPRSGVEAVIGDQLAGWLAADMAALCELVDVTEKAVFRGEVADAARRLHAALGSALDDTG